MNQTTKVILIASAAAAVGAIVQVLVTNRFANKTIMSGAEVADNSGSEWTNIGTVGPYQPNPDLSNPYTGPGGQSSRSNFNGVIWAKRFNKGGNPSSPRNYEPSYAFQSATKNPFANGNNCTYARAVNNATQDPTNQATALVLGPGIAPNNPAA